MAGLGGILARRVAASEGGYFAERSRDALVGLKKKQQHQEQGRASAQEVRPAVRAADAAERRELADVLPEILRHSLPKGFGELPSDSSLKEPMLLKAMKAIKQQVAVKPSSSNGRGHSLVKVSPEVPSAVTFGARKWQLEHTQVVSQTSTANDARTDIPPMTSAQAKAVVDGYLLITKAFAIATTIVFGGAAVGIAIVKSYLGLQSLGDVSVKARELIQPKIAELQRTFEPARSKAENIRNKWHVSEAHDGSFRSELAQSLGSSLKH